VNEPTPLRTESALTLSDLSSQPGFHINPTNSQSEYRPGTLSDPFTGGIRQAIPRDAGIAAVVSLPDHIAPLKYREPDPTPEQAAVDFVKDNTGCSVFAVVWHLFVERGCTDERAERAVKNEIKNGRLVLCGRELFIPSESVRHCERWPLWQPILCALLILAAIVGGAWLVLK
jgi:hypothetical protein